MDPKLQGPHLHVAWLLSASATEFRRRPRSCLALQEAHSGFWQWWWAVACCDKGQGHEPVVELVVQTAWHAKTTGTRPWHLGWTAGMGGGHDRDHPQGKWFQGHQVQLMSFQHPGHLVGSAGRHPPGNGNLLTQDLTLARHMTWQGQYKTTRQSWDQTWTRL